MTLTYISKELKAHAPFTAFGALTGIAVMLLLVWFRVSPSLSKSLFWGFHPFHVFLSALTTAGMYRLHSKGKFWKTFLIGYFGSIGIATLSDCIIPYVGEWMLNLPNKGMHLGFIEKWRPNSRQSVNGFGG